jgi:hypothetical protein
LQQSIWRSAISVIAAVAIAVFSGIFIAIFVGIGLGLLGYVIPYSKAIEVFLSGLVFALGALPSAVAGFSAAWIARYRPIIHGLVAGALYLAWTASVWLSPQDEPISLIDVMHYILMIPLAGLGAWAYKFRFENVRRSAA